MHDWKLKKYRNKIGIYLQQNSTANIYNTFYKLIWRFIKIAITQNLNN